MIISTSGTAAANFFPAVIEASLSRIPLIIISADRPANLIGSGANQTINQKELYGKHVRYFKDVGLPKENLNSFEEILLQAMNHSNGTDLQLPPGPVHLNIPFDEPLLSDNMQKIKYPQFSFESSRRIQTNPSSIPVLSKSSKPLIVVGPMEKNSHQEDIISLSEKIQAPIMADPLSQIRYGYKNENILVNYDHFLQFVDVQPDLIIRFGKKPTSKILCQNLDKWGKQTLLVDCWEKYNDDCPNFIQAPIDLFWQFQINAIDWKGKLEWIKYLHLLDKKIEILIQSETEYSEASITRVCHESLKDGDQFIIGNSMPIRYVDMFTSVTDIQIDSYSNRGASGIDGVVSTALGISAENNVCRSLLIIGDLSFYHDMNGLLASKYEINLTIVVINNNGGGIFSYLPIAETGIETFTQYWTTDTELDLKKVAELYHCQYYKIINLEELRLSIQESFNSKGIHIIEAQTNIEDNVKAHRTFMGKVENALTPT